VEKDCIVLVLQRVIERVIPLVEKEIDIDGPEVESDDGEQKPPRRPAVLREPEWLVIAQASRRTWRRPAMAKGFW
jgi:hypothetical protein